MIQNKFAQVAIDSPLRKIFDYQIPNALNASDSTTGVGIGCRVLVPFGRRKIIGIVVNLTNNSEFDHARIKSIDALLDNHPLFDANSFALISWAAHYYHYPLGAALFTALPPALRKANHDASPECESVWELVTTSDKSTSVHDLSRAPKQRAIVEWLEHQEANVSPTDLNTQFPASRAAIQALAARGFIRQVTTTISTQAESLRPAEIQLTEEQRGVSESIIQAMSTFTGHLLEGVTGSGKTELYFELITHVLTRQTQAQVLILVPEIGLTPQMHARLVKHFGIRIGLLHSNTTEKQRKQTWLSIARGETRIILGTRLAVFTPIPHLALIVVDEEHDASLKQQEGFLYHARDVAIYRAKQLDIPVVLGSATPSFESLHNAHIKKYTHLHLRHRALSNVMPSIQLADMRTEQAGNILSAPLRHAMSEHLEAGRQVILFLNRRGYSPALLCHDCGWVARCERCDTNMTYHRQHNKLICHHCDSHRPKPTQCTQCHSGNLIMVGYGTQRIEESLPAAFNDYSCVRLDRDITRRKGALETTLQEIQQLQHQIIIGTQILSKGHDFPNVSLVGILDIDYGIHSADFRALERSAQLLIQVAGRSGRRHTQGEVIVQTHTPDHPLLQTLIHQGYATFAEQALASRAQWKLPPYAHHVTIRARCQTQDGLFEFLDSVKSVCRQLLPQEISIQGPINAAMERKAGQYRAYVLLTSEQRGMFSHHLGHCLQRIETLKQARAVKWSVDVDPIDNFV